MEHEAIYVAFKSTKSSLLTDTNGGGKDIKECLGMVNMSFRGRGTGTAGAGSEERAVAQESLAGHAGSVVLLMFPVEKRG